MREMLEGSSISRIFGKNEGERNTPSQKIHHKAQITYFLCDDFVKDLIFDGILDIVLDTFT